MVKEIKMPSAGQTTDSAYISRWKVKAGDAVKRGDVLLDAETDKALLPVESFSDGVVLELLVSEGDTVDAGCALAVIGSAEDAAGYVSRRQTNAASEPAACAESSPVGDEYTPICRRAPKAQEAREQTPPCDAPSGKPYRAMPNAKRLAAQKGVDLAALAAHTEGVIKRADVEALGDSSAQMYELSRIRKIIGRRMLESVTTIPAFRLSVEIDMTHTIAMKDAWKDDGVKISYSDVLMKCVATASERFELVRARYEQGVCRVYQACNIGLAVSLEEGLIVPVARSVERMRIAEIAAYSQALVEKARAGTLSNDDIGCGSLTISNLGMYGVKQFDAIINPPESCILAMGAIAQAVSLRAGQPVSTPTMCLSGSFDHRIMDGAYAAAFMQTLKRLMENPVTLFEREA